MLIKKQKSKQTTNKKKKHIRKTKRIYVGGNDDLLLRFLLNKIPYPYFIRLMFKQFWKFPFDKKISKLSCDEIVMITVLLFYIKIRRFDDNFNYYINDELHSELKKIYESKNNYFIKECLRDFDVETDTNKSVIVKYQNRINIGAEGLKSNDMKKIEQSIKETKIKEAKAELLLPTATAMHDEMKHLNDLPNASLVEIFNHDNNDLASNILIHHTHGTLIPKRS